MKKPIYEDYHRQYLDTNSITEAERMVDEDRERYAMAMTKWFNSLTPEDRKAAKKDDSVWPYLIKPLIN